MAYHGIIKNAPCTKLRSITPDAKVLVIEFLEMLDLTELAISLMQ